MENRKRGGNSINKNLLPSNAGQMDRVSCDQADELTYIQKRNRKRQIHRVGVFGDEDIDTMDWNNHEYNSAASVRDGSPSIRNLHNVRHQGKGSNE